MTTDELLAEVKAALADGESPMDSPLEHEARAHVRAMARMWLGALVQAVEDQQRQIAELERERQA